MEAANENSNENEIKQYIAVRSDLKLGIGKLAAQVAHASLESFLIVQKNYPEIAQKWLENGGKKIVVKVNNDEDLKKLNAVFNFKKIPCALIQDAGLTQIPKGTITAIGIGPWYSKDLEILKGLKLL